MPYTLLPSLLVRWAIVAVLSLSVCMPVVHAESGEPGLFEALGKLPKSATPPTEPAPLAESSPAPARTVAVPVQERRVALVMGNNAYQHINRLDNAVGDARAMAREFRSLGFEVIEKLDVDQRSMKAAVREFVQRIANGGVGAFFFAGHGVQEGGNNYLLPVDIGALTDPAALPDEAVELYAEIMARIGQSGAKFSLLVIDACRDNPFPRRAGRGVGGMRGLTVPGTPDGMVVVYSAGARPSGQGRPRSQRPVHPRIHPRDPRARARSRRSGEERQTTGQGAGGKGETRADAGDLHPGRPFLLDA